MNRLAPYCGPKDFRYSYPADEETRKTLLKYTKLHSMHSMLEISPAWIQQITIHGSAHVHVSAEASLPLTVGRP